MSHHTVFIHVVGVNFLLSKWQESDDMDLSLIAGRLREKYKNYWAEHEEMNLLVYLAHVLDPRFKLRLESFPSELHLTADMGKIVRKAAYALFDEYKRLNVPETSSAVEEEPKFGRNYLDREFKKYLKEKLRKKALADDRSDLERYLDQPTVEDWGYFDVLNWWRSSKYEFPILSNMACDLLTVPVSRAVLDSTFSTGGYIHDSFSKKSSKILKVLISTQNWLHLSHCPICVEDDVQHLEEVEKDLKQFAIEPTIVDL
ncbi:hypothetical protein ACH5RR_041766 [Cinchona calisaya]|uniref:Transposase n=1 Tax=Cinchona calisaya TaxID=153742 RepID=A0ABD2XUG9_9GENT